jgi:hypothetical protein
MEIPRARDPEEARILAGTVPAIDERPAPPQTRARTYSGEQANTITDLALRERALERELATLEANGNIFAARKVRAALSEAAISLDAVLDALLEPEVVEDQAS